MRYRNGFPEYVPVARKREKAAQKLQELRKRGKDLQPVIIEGRNVARTWWGKAWNLNLERYADYGNRICRGRSYVRHGAVLDLRIEPGEIRALVQGSRAKPYTVSITIAALRQEVWQKMRTACEGMLESLQDLIEGRFPRALEELFMAKGSGLFPSPQEITFTCSCPDWAHMCKHVAAVLYGTGARLDADPKLFFILRKVAMDDLVRQAVAGTADRLLARASVKSTRIIEDSDLSAVFGIELEEPSPGGGGECSTGTKKGKTSPKAPAKSTKKKETATAERKTDTPRPKKNGARTSIGKAPGRKGGKK
ncbi:MAG: SWIM zinc finger family protein [Alphaproteobacteria bacterium]|uniref:SWIM zinc finger family protein n=1 Tax=Candidatus Nitrobium versatile TaxID=2884831 RepID=A0A953M0R8_9BACT|nr:SWIM zinc finger family protein [Candidatus Nitrobium versatile]